MKHVTLYYLVSEHYQELYQALHTLHRKKKIPKPRESIFCRKALKIEQKGNKKTFPVLQRRKTININELKQNSSRNLDNKSRRKTVHICQPNKENSPEAVDKFDKNYTPWRNKALSMR